ncbi:MAG TPA: GYD domain-containing protein [Vicinamibacteria bacterium]|nr:GYD domain-containing protein [Vicinamibacteria bacterium]
MARFLIQATYTASGAKGLTKDGGSGRRSAVDKALGALGGKLESFYFALGATDAFVLIDVPDAVTAVALSLAVNASGAVRSSITPLLTVEEMDAACKKTVAYRAPGA